MTWNMPSFPFTSWRQALSSVPRMKIGTNLPELAFSPLREVFLRNHGYNDSV